MAEKRKKSPNGSGTIRKRSDGRWEGRYTAGFDKETGKAKQKSVYGKTQAEVAQKIRKLTAEIDAGTYIDISSVTLEDWLIKWQKIYLINIKDTTKKSYQDNINLHIIPQLGKIKIGKLTPYNIQEFYQFLITEGHKNVDKDGNITYEPLSAKTVKNIHAILHKALKQATLPPHSLIKINPADAVVLPKVVKKEMNILTEEQISVFIDAISHHWFGPIYIIALFCGLRRGECIAIKLENIDREKKCIKVDSQIQRDRLNKTGLHVTSLKNDTPRTIYPPQIVFDYIDWYLEMVRDPLSKLHADEWTETGLLFVNETGGYLDPDNVLAVFKTILRNNNLPDVRLHDLRHTFATINLAQGVDIKTLQESLGHYDPGFTLKQYGHSTEKMKQAQQSQLDSFVNENDLSKK